MRKIVRKEKLPDKSTLSLNIREKIESNQMLNNKELLSI